jgi:hypothetical protein
MGMGSGSGGWILGVVVAILIIGGIAWLATSGDRNVANNPSGTATENTGSSTGSAPATRKAPAPAPATTPAPSTTPPQK